MRTREKEREREVMREGDVENKSKEMREGEMSRNIS